MKNLKKINEIIIAGISINILQTGGEFRLTLMSSLAQDEVRKLSNRVKFGIKRMIKDEKIVGCNLTCCYKKCYKNRNGKPHFGTPLKRFLINPRYKGYYIANFIRVENYKTHKKVKFPKSEQVIYITDVIEPIVSEELWDRTNKLYKKYNIRNMHVATT